MSYSAAITKKIANEFYSEEVQNQVNQIIFNSNRSGNQSRRKLTPAEIEKIEAEKKTKERILLANSVAADFMQSHLLHLLRQDQQGHICFKEGLLLRMFKHLL